MLWVLIRIASPRQMSTNNIRFYGEITKIISLLSSNTLLIFSTGYVLISNDYGLVKMLYNYRQNFVYCHQHVTCWIYVLLTEQVNGHSELLSQFRESDLGCNMLDFMMT